MLFPRNSGFRLILSRHGEKWWHIVNEDSVKRETLRVYCYGLMVGRRRVRESIR